MKIREQLLKINWNLVLKYVCVLMFIYSNVLFYNKLPYFFIISVVYMLVTFKARDKKWFDVLLICLYKGFILSLFGCFFVLTDLFYGVSVPDFLILCLFIIIPNVCFIILMLVERQKSIKAALIFLHILLSFFIFYILLASLNFLEIKRYCYITFAIFMGLLNIIIFTSNMGEKKKYIISIIVDFAIIVGIIILTFASTIILIVSYLVYRGSNI